MSSLLRYIKYIHIHDCAYLHLKNISTVYIHIIFVVHVVKSTGRRFTINERSYVTELLMTCNQKSKTDKTDYWYFD